MTSMNKIQSSPALNATESRPYLVVLTRGMIRETLSLEFMVGDRKEKRSLILIYLGARPCIDL